MKLDRVTITGADDSIKPTDLLALSKKYPFVEWGILMSLSNQGNTVRFPSRRWIDSLVAMKQANPDVKLSAHLCGKYVRDLVEHGENRFRDEQALLWHLCDRIQLNFHGNWHTMSEWFLKVLPTFKGKQVIFQVDGINDMAWVKCKDDCDAVPFFDASHGAGVKPSGWPSAFSGVMNGYSGGLGPEGLTQDIEAISEAAGDETFWIDMESRVRSSVDREFDLEKVERCLEAAAPHMSQKG